MSVHRPLDDQRYVVVGLCGHWWQTDPWPVNEVDHLPDYEDCPDCGRPPGAVLMWVELWPDMGRLGPGVTVTVSP